MLRSACICMLFIQVGEESSVTWWALSIAFHSLEVLSVSSFQKQGIELGRPLVRHSLTPLHDLTYWLNEHGFLFTSFSLNSAIHLLLWKCVYCKICTVTVLISLNSSLPEWYNMHRIYYDIVLLHSCSLNVSNEYSENECLYCKPVMSTCQAVVCVKIRKWQWGYCVICPSEKLWNKWKWKRKTHHLSKRRKKPHLFFIFNQRALVDVLHVCLSSPLSAFLHFFLLKVSKANPAVLG